MKTATLVNHYEQRVQDALEAFNACPTDYHAEQLDNALDALNDSKRRRRMDALELAHSQGRYPESTQVSEALVISAAYGLVLVAMVSGLWKLFNLFL